MRFATHHYQPLHAPFLGGTVFTKPGAQLLPSPGHGKERSKVARKVLNIFVGKLGITQNGETWFQVRQKEGGKSSAPPSSGHEALDLPRMPLSTRGCVALAACTTSPALLILSSVPFLYSALRAGLFPACPLRSSLLAPLLPLQSVSMEIGFYT